MLHHVDNNPHASLKGWAISNGKFLELLDCIEQKGLHTTTFQTIAERDFTKKDLRGKIILTFDDCPASLFEFAIPELIKRKMKAVFYIPTDFIGKFNSWDVEEQGFEKVSLFSEAQIKYLSLNGMEIGCHGAKHLRLNLITPRLLTQEINFSKIKLEETLCKRVFSFAYPYAQIPKNHKIFLNDAGYKFGVGLYIPFPNNFALRRIGIHQSDSKDSILRKIGYFYSFLRSFTDPLLSLLEKIKV